ncbi:hypothetical protein J3R30DRAFT_3706059 [Lentinula aciculospora]|uniref:DUF6593 domain-containing protein n=1 Tax=Lentinula aciculospora TaxID=153920 RepID=A0A9W9A6H4_9AGAR|nr:hypothetical protein J3R30DRAFT_3706059 [Lentinula aciculospora]
MSTLNLYQRKSNFESMLENTYHDDQGNTVYTVHTPLAMSMNRTTTISKTIRDPFGNARTLAAPAAEGSTANENKVTLDTTRNSTSCHDDDASLASGGEHKSVSVNDKPYVPHDVDDKNAPLDSKSAVSKQSGNFDRANFEYIAQIDWKMIKSTKIRFATGQRSGKEIHVKDLFRRQGWGAWGRHHIFTGEDGKEYKWRMVRNHSEMVSNDSSKTLIAKSHAKMLFHSKQNPPRLEIFPTGLHMVDEIFVTFCYIERMRQAMEESTWLS